MAAGRGEELAAARVVARADRVVLLLEDEVAVGLALGCDDIVCALSHGLVIGKVS